MIHHSAFRTRVALVLCGLLFAGSVASGQVSLDDDTYFVGSDACDAGGSLEPKGWYSGDTHDHLQGCTEPIHSLQAAAKQMHDLGLDVSSLLVWDPNGEPFIEYACNVTGSPVGNTGESVIQFGVETSGLDVSKWGHLIGINIGPSQARISRASGPGACYTSSTGLGLGCMSGDGTGLITSPVAQHFAGSSKAVRGMAHQAWPVGIYSSLGYDWNTELVVSGFTTDAVALDTGQKLAFPKIFENGLELRAFPALGAVDVALGNVEFLETGDMDFDYRFGHNDWPVSLWWGAYYRLLNAGLRVSPAGGRDTGCQPAGTQSLGSPRTWCRVEGPLTYDKWTKALADGKVSITMGAHRFLDMKVDGTGIGGQVEIASPTNTVSVEVTLQYECEGIDHIEILRNGKVVAVRRISMGLTGKRKRGRVFGTRKVTVDVPITRSGWIGARLRTNSAHTGATYVLLDDDPIADCNDAEYWMLWCDRISTATQDNPSTHFGCQDTEVLDTVADARKVFKALRDYDFYSGGAEPAWGLTRQGTSTNSCRGPINISLSDSPVAGSDFSFVCTNAPPDSSGFLYVSTSPLPGTCVSNVKLWVDPMNVVTPAISSSTRASGTAETPVNATIKSLSAGTTLYAQFVWSNTTDCPGNGCVGASSLSASDSITFDLLP